MPQNASSRSTGSPSSKPLQAQEKSMAETQTATRQALLSINTLVEREFIRIDGQSYDLRSVDDLSILDYRRLAKMGEQLKPLMQAYEDDTLTPEQATDFDDRLDRLCRAVLEAPSDVFSKLQTVHRLNIALAFMGLSLPRLRQARAAQLEAMPPSKTPSSRRGSRGSTAARRKRG
jgi:hypothetical protein